MKDCSAASCLLERPKYRQVSLFPDILCSAYLLAPDSPKSAFYRIWIESDDGVFTVCKESGGKDKVLDQRVWPFDSLEEARKLFDRRVRDQTQPQGIYPPPYIFVSNV